MLNREPTTEELDSLREQVRPYLTEKRYAHTLAVEKQTAYMAEILMPEHEGRLRAAALLHDIAKKLTYEKQLNYIRECDIINAGTGTHVPVEVAHAPAGAAMVIAHFPQWADPDIVSAVRYHTTGRGGMTMFESIVFLADYIEPTRKYESCRRLYGFIHDNLASGGEDILRRALMECMAQTVTYLSESGHGTDIDENTVSALEYLKRCGSLPRTLS